MAAGDVPTAAEIVLRGGWGNRSTFLGWAVRHPSCHAFVATGEADGTIVGTAIATEYGSVGWVGSIFVDVDHRGRGIGRALTRTTIADLEDRGCRTLVLIATEAGRRIYEDEGFTIDAAHFRYTPPSTGQLLDDVGSTQAFTSSMLPEILELDEAATGEDRSAVLRTLVGPDSTRVTARTDGSVGGFLVEAPWNRAAVIASTPDDAIRLLEWRRRSDPAAHVAVALFDRNEAGRSRLRAEGWIEGDGGVRMIRGDPVAWQPDWIWSHFNGTLG